MALSVSPHEIVESGEYPLLVKHKSWERVPLEFVAKVQNGFAFESKYFDRERGVPLIRIRDVTNTSTEHKYTGEYPDEFLVSAGDILIGMDGDFIASRWRGSSGLLNQRVCRLLPCSASFDTSFLFLCLQPYLNAINEETSSVTVKHLSSRSVQQIPLPLPPLAEQRRIVAKIEELFSEIDNAMEALTTARNQIDAYRQALLRYAFKGLLTKGWRRHNQQLVGSPQALESELITNGIVNAERVSQSELGKIPQIPEEWAYFRVASLCSVVRGGSPRPAGDPKYYGGSIPFLKVADLTRTPGMYLSTHTSTIKEAGLHKTRMTPPNTLLISNSGATLGVPKICTFETTFNDGVAAFLEVPEGYLEYFYLFWESKTSELRGINQGAAQPNLNTSILGETRIPMCTKAEAKEVVKLLQAALSTVEHQAEEIEQHLIQAAALRQAILKRAFSGQLVTQDPKDEPASVLLERIKAEKELAKGEKRIGRNKKEGKEAA